MAAFELTTRVDVARFTVVAIWSERPLVRHVALLPTATVLERGRRVSVYDMGPPLRAGQVGTNGKALVLPLAPHVVATVPLTEEEELAVQLNIEELRRRIPHPQTRVLCDEAKVQYIALPAYEEFDARKSGGLQFALRCSCVGLILYAFRDVVELIDEAKLPEVDLATIQAIWRPTLEDRERAGLGGDGPWRVVLPGYVFHALRDGKPEPAYVAQASDAFFPVAVGPSAGPSSPGVQQDRQG